RAKSRHGRQHGELVTMLHEVVRANFQDNLEQLVLGPGVAGLALSRNDPAATSLEHPSNSSVGPQIAAVFLKDHAHIRGGAMAVISQDLQHQRNATGAIALVADLVEVAEGTLAGALLDRL